MSQPGDAVSARITSMDQVFKDYYPLPGTRIKQYVVDQRAFWEWERSSSPRFYVSEHDAGDDTQHDGRLRSAMEMEETRCEFCEGFLAAIRQYDIRQVSAWYDERAERRSLICDDRTKLSDEIAPDPSAGRHPMMQMLRKP